MEGNNMPYGVTATVRDHSGEPSRFSMSVSDATSPAVAISAMEAAMDAARDDGLIGGNTIRATVSIDGAILQADAIAGAQRENKLVVAYRDITENFDVGGTPFANAGFGKNFTSELPTFLTEILPEGSDVVPLASTEAAGFILAAEASFVSPYGGQIEITQLRYAGRNI
jgi:hypothetical protein